MTDKEIEEKVKEYIMNQLHNSKVYAKTKEEKIIDRTRAFGALSFACQKLFSTYNTSLSEWWMTEVRNQFTE